MRRIFTPAMAGAAALLLAVPMAGLAQDDLTPEEAALLASLEEALPGTLMNNPLIANWETYGEGFRARVVEADEIPGARAYQVRVRERQPNPWDISAHGPVRDGVEEGDVVLVAFWARASAPDKKAGRAGLTARLQEKKDPYAAVAEGALELLDRWQLHYVSGRASRSFAPGELDMSYNVGDLKQTVEFGQYYVMNMGPDVDPATLPSGSTDG